MIKSKLRMSRVASAFALVLGLISTGVVVAHTCHTEVSNVVAHLDHGHSLPDETAGSTQNLLNEICIGVIFFFLLFGGKYLHKIFRIHSFQRLEHIWRHAVGNIRPPNLTNSLSLTQLGISRI